MATIPYWWAGLALYGTIYRALNWRDLWTTTSGGQFVSDSFAYMCIHDVVHVQRCAPPGNSIRTAICFSLGKSIPLRVALLLININRNLTLLDVCRFGRFSRTNRYAAAQPQFKLSNLKKAKEQSVTFHSHGWIAQDLFPIFRKRCKINLIIVTRK